MPRQIEVQSEGEWKLWNEAHPLPDIPWRYVGGVLEMESGFGDWIPMLQHYASIEEARAAVGQPHLRIRLRPYDDAEALADVYTLTTDRDALARKVAAYSAMLRMGESCSLETVVRELVAMGRICKDAHDSDAHGWEVRENALKVGEAWLATLTPPAGVRE